MDIETSSDEPSNTENTSTSTTPPEASPSSEGNNPSSEIFQTPKRAKKRKIQESPIQKTPKIAEEQTPPNFSKDKDRRTDMEIDPDDDKTPSKQTKVSDFFKEASNSNH
jgi:hypothetical protein